MAEVLRSPTHFDSSLGRISSSSSSSSSTPSSSLSCVPQPSLTCPTPPNDFPLVISMTPHPPSPSSSSAPHAENGDFPVTNCEAAEVKYRDKLSLLAFLFALVRKSLIACKSGRRELCAIEIGSPTNVRHVAHVTFDRFNGFLGLPVELEPEVPSRAPSACTTVFGVSTDSMQLSYDPRGNSIPTILLLMQRHLYARGGLLAEGIFRINGENSQEEYVRDELNRGIVSEGIELHCLAGLIKAWFRELPIGILDSLSAEQVVQCQTEEECAELVRNLPSTEAALLDWSVNLMADVVQEERFNKMNARNIAMVFAPNMTRMADPITALVYAVQVMNFLKTLILRTLREREDSIDGPDMILLEPSDENEPHGRSLACPVNTFYDEEEVEAGFTSYEPALEANSGETLCGSNVLGEIGKLGGGNSSLKNGSSEEKVKGVANLSFGDWWTERIEAWR